MGAFEVKTLPDFGNILDGGMHPSTSVIDGICWFHYKID